MNETKTQQPAAQSLPNPLTGDPDRDQHEKETGIQLEGDREALEITSYKKVVYEKLLQHPAFTVKHRHVRTENRQQKTVKPGQEVGADPSLTIVGVTGQLSVGALSIKTPRNSNSHAKIVK